jgi:amino acid adenylation domain-containing protein
VANPTSFHVASRAPSADEFGISLQARLVQSARANSHRIAVIDPERELSYADLLGLSAQLATHIVAQPGIAPPRVALLFDQDARYVVALVAVLRAGCTYVPLDPRRGHDWNADVLRRTGCELVLSSREHAGMAGEFELPVEIVDLAEIALHDTGICVQSAPDSIACIYSTSGTTGEPKAVCDVHRNLLHNSWRYAHSLEASPDDRMSLIQAPIFSGTQSTIFMGLLSGAALCCFDVAARGLRHLPDWLVGSRVTMFHSVPSIFRTLARPGLRYDDIRLVRIEGDQATHEDVRVLRAHFHDDCVMVNGLGATECGLVRQYFVTRDTAVVPGNLPLGRPVPDMEVAVLDDRGQPCAPKQAGEVVVTSRYLAAGYLGDDARTKARFRDGAGRRRSYHTGDVGYLDDDGLLWLHGRSDRLVKIHGITVSLDAIEGELTQLSNIDRALVASHADADANAILVAYLMCKPSARPPLEDMRRAIAERLSPEQRPARIMWLEELPVTIDGKVDRSALPAPTGERPDMATRYVAPRSGTERTLAQIWQRILGIAPIGVHDDLIALGCDSIAIVQCANRVRSAMRAELRVAAFFDQPTIEAIARTLEDDLETATRK